MRPAVYSSISFALAALLATNAVHANEAAVSTVQSQTPNVLPAKKPSVLVLTDIGAEVDDSQSFVRFLLYANQFDIQGLVATTSTWQRDKVQPDLLRERINAYGQVLKNLEQHAAGYPDPAYLQSLVRSGAVAFGMTGVGDGEQTAASQQIVEAVDRSDRPLWVVVWGGAVDLAQALWDVRAERSTEEVEAFVNKLRVYTISDQDDAGPWIRGNFPDLFCISSVHGWNQYYNATWVGISGDLLLEPNWPYREMVTNAWVESNIQKGPLGQLYPLSKYIMEGDTPSFLGLIDNGLNLSERPDFGGWGGRYVKASPSGGHYSDSTDRWVDDEGQLHYSNHASIFRWRAAFQNDFAARIAWTTAEDYSKANHHPVVAINGVSGKEILELPLDKSGKIILDAGASIDPDGDKLSYKWWVYSEASGYRGKAPITLEAEGEKALLTVSEVNNPSSFHVILEVTDDGEPALTSYRRVVLRVAAASKEKSGE